MRQTEAPVPKLLAYFAVGKRFRAVSDQIGWNTIGNSSQALCEAYDSLQRPAKLAGEVGLMTVDEKIASLYQVANNEAGEIVRAAIDLQRGIDLERQPDAPGLVSVHGFDAGQRAGTRQARQSRIRSQARGFRQSKLDARLLPHLRSERRRRSRHHQLDL